MKGARFTVGSIVAVGLLAGSAIGVAAQEAEPPTEFSGRWVYSDTIEVRDAGGTWAYLAEEISEPRFDGRISIVGNESVLSNGASVWSSAFRVENDEGAWQEVPAPLLRFDHATASTRTGLFEGEGAYEGLVAVAELGWDVSGADSVFDVRGIILGADDPPPSVIVADAE